jgi:hypothetical protein
LPEPDRPVNQSTAPAWPFCSARVLPLTRCSARVTLVDCSSGRFERFTCVLPEGDSLIGARDNGVIHIPQSSPRWVKFPPAVDQHMRSLRASGCQGTPGEAHCSGCVLQQYRDSEIYSDANRLEQSVSRKTWPSSETNAAPARQWRSTFVDTGLDHTNPELLPLSLRRRRPYTPRTIDMMRAITRTIGIRHRSQVISPRISVTGDRTS